MQWHNQSFQTLDTLTLYRLLQLRSRIFVVEQNCVFLDIDDQDQQARHLFYGNPHEIAAYARILRLPESHTAQAAIGRIVVAEAHRRRGLASQALQQAMDYILNTWQLDRIYLQAQSHLVPFYEQHGYRCISAEYLEDGIPHTDMLFSRPDTDG